MTMNAIEARQRTQDAIAEIQRQNQTAKDQFKLSWPLEADQLIGDAADKGERSTFTYISGTPNTVKDKKAVVAAWADEKGFKVVFGTYQRASQLTVASGSDYVQLGFSIDW